VCGQAIRYRRHRRIALSSKLDVSAASTRSRSATAYKRGRRNTIYSRPARRLSELGRSCGTAEAGAEPAGASGPMCRATRYQIYRRPKERSARRSRLLSNQPRSAKGNRAGGARPLTPLMAAHSRQFYLRGGFLTPEMTQPKDLAVFRKAHKAEDRVDAAGAASWRPDSRLFAADGGAERGGYLASLKATGERFSIPRSPSIADESSRYTADRGARRVASCCRWGGCAGREICSSRWPTATLGVAAGTAHRIPHRLNVGRHQHRRLRDMYGDCVQYSGAVEGLAAHGGSVSAVSCATRCATSRVLFRGGHG